MPGQFAKLVGSGFSGTYLCLVLIQRFMSTAPPALHRVAVMQLVCSCVHDGRSTPDCRFLRLKSASMRVPRMIRASHLVLGHLAWCRVVRWSNERLVFVALGH